MFLLAATLAVLIESIAGIPWNEWLYNFIPQDDRNRFSWTVLLIILQFLPPIAIVRWALRQASAEFFKVRLARVRMLMVFGLTTYVTGYSFAISFSFLPDLPALRDLVHIGAWLLLPIGRCLLLVSMWKLFIHAPVLRGTGDERLTEQSLTNESARQIFRTWWPWIIVALLILSVGTLLAPVIGYLLGGGSAITG